MTTEEIEEKFSVLVRPQAGQFSMLRIDSSLNCRPELYLGIDSNENRTVLLQVPDGMNHAGFLDERENLRTKFLPEDCLLILELTDSFYNKIFNDLILSLYNRLKDIHEPRQSAEIFSSTVNIWTAFLSPQNEERLNEKDLAGLMGELFLLDVLIETSQPVEVNDILEAWKGPLDDENDFYFDDRNIEVKTKSSGKIEVEISSEFQLEEVPGKGLELNVISYDKDPLNGVNLGILINELREKILLHNGDIVIFYRMLREAGLQLTDLEMYDYFKLKFVSLERFNCLEHDFPRLSASNIPESLSDLKYKLNLSYLTPFLIDSTRF